MTDEYDEDDEDRRLTSRLTNGRSVLFWRRQTKCLYHGGVAQHIYETKTGRSFVNSAGTAERCFRLIAMRN